MIARLYDIQIQKMLRQFPVVCLLGPRQSGKTTAAKNYLKSYKGKCIYLDLESSADLRKLEYAELFLKQFQDYLIVIDEIQFKPDLFPLLRHLVDEKRKNGRFLILGSADPALIKGASESLAGRIYYIDTAPFNLKELSLHKPSPGLQAKHWLRGGFPSAWLARGETAWENWMDAFTRTFIERDMNKLFGTTFTPALLRTIWQLLATQSGGKWNAQQLAKGLDVSPTTINRYLDFLEAAFMVRKLQPFSSNAKKMLVKTPKIYLRDSGILHHFLGIQNNKQLLMHPQLGYSWEGYVIEQILQLANRNWQTCYYATHDGTEMDLVLAKANKAEIAIEIKLSPEAKLSRGFYESISDLKVTKAFVINSSELDDYKLDKITTVCGLKVFLTKYVFLIK